MSETFSHIPSSVPFSAISLPLYDVCLTLTMFHSGYIFRSGILQRLHASRFYYILPLNFASSSQTGYFIIDLSWTYAVIFNTSMSALYDFVLCFYTLHLIGHYSVLKILLHFHANINTVSTTSMSILPTTSASLFCFLNLLLRVRAILLFIYFLSFRQKFPRNDHRWYSPDWLVNSIEYHEYR